VVCIAAVEPVLAQDFFPAARPFVLDQACDATRSIRGASDPKPIAAGTTVVGRGVNRPDNPTHAFVSVEGENRWIALTCGRFTDGTIAAPSKGAGPAGGDASCLPFFDTVDNPVVVGVGGRVDASPPPPTLTPFDEAAAAVCGAPGKKVSRAEFQTLLRSHPDVLGRIKSFTGSRVFPGKPAAASDEAYLTELTEAWFEVHAYDHIFCGEPSAEGGGKIGGLHFHARYLQLQKAGQACRMTNFRQNEIVPGSTYTVGVIIRMPDGREIRDARKGYGLTLNAEDLLKLITRAFNENPGGTAADTTACVLPVTDDGQAFSAIFARRSTGIRTFYPDATPNGRGSRINPPCTGGIALQ
jgi:hypothetical protein